MKTFQRIACIVLILAVAGGTVWSQDHSGRLLKGIAYRQLDGTFTLFFTVMKEPTDYWEHMGEEGYMLDTGFDSMGMMQLRLAKAP